MTTGPLIIFKVNPLPRPLSPSVAIKCFTVSLHKREDKVAVMRGEKISRREVCLMATAKLPWHWFKFCCYCHPTIQDLKWHHSIVCIMTDISLRLYQLSETHIMQLHATVNTNCKQEITNTIVSFSGLLYGRLRAEHLDHSLWRIGKNELVVPQGKMEAFAAHRCHLHPPTNNIQWVGDKLACKPIRWKMRWYVWQYCCWIWLKVFSFSR